MNLFEKLKKIFSGSFIKDVVKLSLGTAAGRGVTVAALPLLTRLYSPEDFAVLATFAAIISTIAVAACLRFEIAIPLAENDDDAKYLLILGFLSLITVTLLVIFFMYLLEERITVLTDQSNLKYFFWMIPLGIFAIGLYSISQYWATRARQFTEIAKTRLSQAFLGVGVSLSLGWFGITPFGLLLGNIINTSAGSLVLARWSIKNDSFKFKKLAFKYLKKTAIKYRRFAIYSTPESLFNTAGVHVPIIFVGFYAGAEAGFLMLAMQIMAAPMSLLGRSISQVYVSRVQEVLLDGELAIYTRMIIWRLLKVGFLPFLFVGMISPSIVPYVFGPEWVRTGEIISWLVPCMLLQFLVSPVSMSLHVIGQQSLAMVLQIFGFLIRTGSVFIATQLMGGYIVEAYAISGAIFYAVYIIVVNKAINKK